MSALARVGLVILAVGLFGDLIYHSLPLLTAAIFGSDGIRAHLVVFFGMLLVVTGLVQQGFETRRSHSLSGRGAFSAHR